MMTIVTEPTSATAAQVPRLISDRPDPQGWESYPRRAQCPRYRQRPLVPWQPKLIEEKPTGDDEPGEDGH